MDGKNKQPAAIMTTQFVAGMRVAATEDYVFIDGLMPKGTLGIVIGVNPKYPKEYEVMFEGRPVITSTSPHRIAPAVASAEIEAGTLDELCRREIVKIRELTLKDDEYTGGLLGDAVGSPVGITLCVEARMKQIVDLQAEIKRLKKQVANLKRKSNLDDGFIDYLTTDQDES